MALKNRLLFLSPSVLSGQERECKASDFENLDRTPLGEGAFGSVYRVRHKATGKNYAIKLMGKRDILSNRALPLVRREVRIMYSLNHPYVIKLHNHFEDNRFFYLILELAEGGSLYKYASKSRGLDEPQVAQFMREVAIGVHYLHHKSPPIIHRDIKPENILLDANNTAKLGDFGWSNFYTETQRQTLCGTPEYLAPEMINKSGHSTSLDLWNLGILMFELLAGHAPFRARSGEELYKKILLNKLEFPVKFPLGARDLVQNLLKSNPAERISIEQFLDHPWMKSHAPIRPTVEISFETETLPIEDEDCTIPNERPTIAFKPSDYTVIGNTDSERSPSSPHPAAIDARKKRLQVLEANLALKTHLVENIDANTAKITEFLNSAKYTKDLKFYGTSLEGLSKTVKSQKKKSDDLDELIQKRETQGQELSEQLRQLKRELRGFYAQRAMMVSELTVIKRELMTQKLDEQLSLFSRALGALQIKAESEADSEVELKELLADLQTSLKQPPDTFQTEVDKLNARLSLRRKELTEAEMISSESLIVSSVRKLLDN
mmetsp:Transcript_16906/g.30270  ORF Transcript_16906/g.30270 Transcript_16906/m.30270 type:complete len:549 (-) Transcript_16906:17533-19179(-)